MRFNMHSLMLLLLVCAPLHAKQDTSIPLELIELLGEWDETDQAIAEEAMTNIPAKLTPQAQPASSAPSTGDSQ